MSYQYQSIIKAIRQVKRLLIEECSDRVIFMHNKHSDNYFVYTDASATEWMLEQLFLEYSDVSPEEFITQIKVIDYISRTDVENFGGLYTQFKPTMFSKNYYRRQVSIEPEYTVTFNLVAHVMPTEGGTKYDYLCSRAF